MRNALLVSLVSLTMISSVPEAASADLGEGLVAYYPFNGNADDETGNGYDGIMHGVTATEDRIGNPNSAFAFDGVNDYIDLGRELNFPTWNSYAISVWFLQDGGGHPGPGSYGQKILSKQTWFNDWWLSVYPHNGPYIGLLAFQTCYGSHNPATCYSSIVDYSDNYSDSVWHHVAINKTGSHAELWVDGEVKGTVGDIRSPNNNVRLMIGYSDHGDSLQKTYWSGKIDDLRIYDRFLDESEIQELSGANRPPVAISGPPEVVECTDSEATSVELDGSGSYDPEDDPITCVWLFDAGGQILGCQATALLPLGTYAITLVVEDDHGGTGEDTVVKSVADTTPPEIESHTADPEVLWPPNHRMRSVTVEVTSSDVCDNAPASCSIAGVSSNEPENGIGDGDIAPDWEITGDLTVDLRAERAGGGDGRIYTLAIACEDASGNVATAEVGVTVPHDRRR